MRTCRCDYDNKAFMQQSINDFLKSKLSCFKVLWFFFPYTFFFPKQIANSNLAKNVLPPTHMRYTYKTKIIKYVWYKHIQSHFQRSLLTNSE